VAPLPEPNWLHFQSQTGSTSGAKSYTARVTNPFQVTKPVDSSEVIDREAEADQLVELAFEGNNARLVAPRRFGKTSLIHRVQHQLDDQGWVTVYVDLLGIISADDFSSRIERAYTQQLKGPVAKWFAGVRRQLKPTFTGGGGPVPASLSIDLSGPSKEALADRLDLPRRIWEKTGDRIHVVFDEFQELDRIPQKNVDQVLRSVIQHHGDAASYVFAGSALHMMEMMFADRTRAFFGQTKKVVLHPLHDEPLAGYVVDRFQTTGKDLTTTALDALLSLVLGHPQRAMLAAHALWNASSPLGDLGEWEVARTHVMEEADDELRVLWMNLDVPDREVLVRLAAGLTPFARSPGGSRGGGIVRAVDGLLAQGVVTTVADGQRQIVDPLFTEWIRAQRGAS
jgi:hypothetical protein